MDDETTMKIKAFVADDIDLDEDERSAVSYVTTVTPDHDDEVMLPSGMDKTEYVKNSVVLWMHDHYLGPIGRCAWLKRDGQTGWVAKTIFAQTAFAEDIWQLVKGGFLRACSVGYDMFRSEYREPTKSEREKGGWEKVRRVYTKWPLMEYSWVSVGANPDALALAVSEKKLSRRILRYLEIEPKPAVPEPIVVAPARKLIYDPTIGRRIVTT